MTVRTEFPHAIRVIEHVWIPMVDGVRLSARIWLPLDAERHPVPALLEYIPYRKDDWTVPRDALRHPKTRREPSISQAVSRPRGLAVRHPARRRARLLEGACRVRCG